MNTSLWSRDEIRNLLIALYSVQLDQPALCEVVAPYVLRERQAYRDGFNAALQSVALACGIALSPTQPSRSIW